jgi:hypothetical protein
LEVLRMPKSEAEDGRTEVEYVGQRDTENERRKINKKRRSTEGSDTNYE